MIDLLIFIIWATVAALILQRYTPAQRRMRLEEKQSAAKLEDLFGLNDRISRRLDRWPICLSLVPQRHRPSSKTARSSSSKGSRGFTDKRYMKILSFLYGSSAIAAFVALYYIAGSFGL